MDEHNPRDEEAGRTNEDDLVDISDDEEEFEDAPGADEADADEQDVEE